MLIEYLKQQYKEQGEPIFLSDLIKQFGPNVRQETKKLTDNGELERFANGIYFLPYQTILGTRGKMSVTTYIEKKYLYENGTPCGYYSGIKLANQFGFTTQNAAVCEIQTSRATTKQRKIQIDKRSFIIRQPYAIITESNIEVLRFLDLALAIDKYSELQGEEKTIRVKQIMKKNNIDTQALKEYISYYPERVYKALYDIDCLKL